MKLHELTIEHARPREPYGKRKSETMSQCIHRTTSSGKAMAYCSCGWSDGPVDNHTLGHRDLREAHRTHVEQAAEQERRRRLVPS